MRGVIIHQQDTEPGDVDWRSMSPLERAARRRAELMIQEASIIELTHWPFAVLDEQPLDRMAGLLAVISKRDALEREQRRKRS